MSELERKQRLEIAFWRDSIHESPGADSVHNTINKMSDARIFLHCLQRHAAKLEVSRGRVLELGAGQGWASCIYKKLFPETRVTATDISPYAIQSLPAWERLFGVSLDGSYACTSYETAEPSESVDLVFSFSSAHHFLAHRRTLLELERILKPGGRAVYFYEPVTTRCLYRPVKWLVNRKRPDVPEDVLVTKKIRRLAELAGLSLEVDFDPCILRKGPLETVYFAVLGWAPFLQHLLPASANLVFAKAGR